MGEKHAGASRALWKRIDRQGWTGRRRRIVNCFGTRSRPVSSPRSWCRRDAAIAVEKWSRAGYANLSSLDGGFETWEAAGYALLQLDQQ